ncbi:MAG: DUF2945 domain-containing protein [Bacteroidota bacterium]|nr:DUF2945 domain-containing protein [Bacteroidota bacterium]
MKKGQKVKWKWGKGTTEGTIIEAFDHKITKTIKGSEITRDGNSANRALFIEQEDGDKVLKLTSEVEAV